MSMPELKPCPVCKNEAVSYHFSLFCPNGCITFRWFVHNRDEESERAASWNLLPNTVEKMKPCPFCGSSDTSLFHDHWQDIGHVIRCKCWRCDREQLRHFIEDATDAVASWNERAGEK